MTKSRFSATILMLLFATFAFAIITKPARAADTIYIRSDGTVDPPTAPIQRVGNVYEFTDDIFNKSIVIQIDNITLNGKGHLLQGPPAGIAVHLVFRTNVAITNIIISNGWCGIFLDASSNCRILNNHILQFFDVVGIDITYGIKLLQSSHNLLRGNTIVRTGKAIELEGSSYNTLSNNELTNNTHAIWLYSQFSSPTSGNTLRNNAMTSNSYSFLVCSQWGVSGYINDVDTSNTIDGKPIYYWINCNGESIPPDAGCVVIANSSRVTVQNLVLGNNGIGVCLAYTSDSVVENVRALGSYIGLWLQRSNNNVITKSNFTNNDGPGIYLEKSDYNSLTENFIRNSNASGIWLEDCCYPGYNNLIRNTVLYSRGLKPQEWSGAGILVDDSSHCKVIGNNLTGNWYGIVIAATPAVGNQVTENDIVSNGAGLFLGDARYNTIYHNNFIDNDLQVGTHWWPEENTFDNGYPSGGNYWSVYDGADVKKDSSQDQPGSDGIGDTPYIIDEEHQDRYPLMNPLGSSPPPTCMLTINASADGTTDPIPGTYTYSSGQNVPIEALSHIGYILDHWELDGVNVGATNPINVAMNTNHTLRAVFALTRTLAIITTTGGTTNPTPGNYVYAIGTVVSVKATPRAHYHFDCWELDGVNNATNPIIIRMNIDHELKAVFAPTLYTLNITTTTGGTTDPTPATYTYLSGTTIGVKALPETGYYLDYWELDGDDIGMPNPVSVRMDTNHTLHGVFRQLNPGHDIAIRDITSKTVVGSECSSTIQVTIMNIGSYTENFNVTLYINSSIISQTQLTLTSAASATLTFTWNTTTFTKGNYTITTAAAPVPGETNTTDNNYTCWVILSMIGDLTGPDVWPDNKCDMRDIGLVVRGFGANSVTDETCPKYGEYWHPTPCDLCPHSINCDVIFDGKTDMKDVGIVARHFGETDP